MITTTTLSEEEILEALTEFAYTHDKIAVDDVGVLTFKIDGKEVVDTGDFTIDLVVKD